MARGEWCRGPRGRQLRDRGHETKWLDSVSRLGRGWCRPRIPGIPLAAEEEASQSDESIDSRNWITLSRSRNVARTSSPFVWRTLTSYRTKSVCGVPSS